MKIIFDKATLWLDKKKPFVLYAKPYLNKLVGIFQNNDNLFQIEDFSETGFAFVSFDGENKYIIPENESEILKENIGLLDCLEENNIDLSFSETTKKSFETQVEKGIKAIQKNQFAKVVLSRKETIELDNFDFEMVFKKILFYYTNTFRYCFYHPKIGFWVGATPEQFLQVSENKLKTVSIAGTQMFKESQVYAWQIKEQEEQQIVTDFILDNLQNETSNLSFSEPYNFRAGSIVHLKTDIEADLNEASNLQNIINKMHPTPAVCGLPKEPSQKFILENENYNRTFYTGFLGELNFDLDKNNNSDLFVNLRCMNFDNNLVNIYVGCGITKDSIPENEFFETVNKSKTMKMVL